MQQRIGSRKDWALRVSKKCMIKFTYTDGKLQGLLISPYPDLLSGVFCLMVRIFLLMLVFLYI
jgi:hypothetical protein